MIKQISRTLLAHPLMVLCTIGLLVFICHLTTIAEYPACWLDEAMILEFGRTTLFDPNPDASILMIPSANDKLLPTPPCFNYVFGAIQEFLYRYSGSFLCGRIFALSSIPLASLLLFCWLRTKSIPIVTSLITAILFLVDPNATVCAHWYRPDIWTTAFAFLVLIILSRSRNSRSSLRVGACALAGAISAFMPFFWIASGGLLPLIAWEALLSARTNSGVNPIKHLLRDAVVFTVAGLATVVILLTPLSPHFAGMIEFAKDSFVSNAGLVASDTFADRACAFVKIACRSPFVWFLALLGTLVSRRHRIHAALFALLATYMLSTRVYHLRMVQLMPYLFLFAALALEHLLALRRGRRFVRIALSGAILFAFALSVVALNYAAWPVKGNTYREFTDRLQLAAPKNLNRVYLLDAEHETYYSARELGWLAYAYYPHDPLFDPERSANLIDKVDAVIFSTALGSHPTEEQLDFLQRHGLRKTGEVQMPHAQPNRIKAFLSDLFYAHGYPSCEIYTRTANGRNQER